MSSLSLLGVVLALLIALALAFRFRKLLVIATIVLDLLCFQIQYVGGNLQKGEIFLYSNWNFFRKDNGSLYDFNFVRISLLIIISNYVIDLTVFQLQKDEYVGHQSSMIYLTFFRKIRYFYFKLKLKYY